MNRKTFIDRERLFITCPGAKVRAEVDKCEPQPNDCLSQISICSCLPDILHHTIQCYKCLSYSFVYMIHYRSGNLLFLIFTQPKGHSCAELLEYWVDTGLVCFVFVPTKYKYKYKYKCKPSLILCPCVGGHRVVCFVFVTNTNTNTNPLTGAAAVVLTWADTGLVCAREKSPTPKVYA